MAALQLRDLAGGGYRFVASCRQCGYRAAVDPDALLARSEEAQYWTRADIAARLRCSHCKKPLCPKGATPAQISRCLALERPGRTSIAFQGGMLFED